MAPLPLFAISGASAATRKYGTLTLSAYTLSNTSSVVSCVGPNGKTPALLIRISTWPLPSSTALLATSRALDASRRSDAIKSASPPAAWMSATVCSPRAALRPTTMTCIPSWASLLATARPIPLVPPVTSVGLTQKRPRGWRTPCKSDRVPAMQTKVTRLDYCQYLLVSQINDTLTHFADHCAQYSHDAINRYLRGEQITPRLVWENVK